jgi:REP element-mobilizing transposase RayT
LFAKHPEIKKKLWWGELRSKWYYVNTVGKYSNEEVIRAYVRNQWLNWYKSLHKSPYKEQSLFGN